MSRTAGLWIGCAGWTIPRTSAGSFAAGESHLHRYAQRFSAVEINSSFYRPHKPATYSRWAASVPDDFRFAVKIPKAVTHEQRLRFDDGVLDAFCEAVAHLGGRLGCLLVQLPPSLKFEPAVAEQFFTTLGKLCSAPAACEPRHASWFTPEAEALLASFKIARVAADPAPVPEAAEPGGAAHLIYHRLHGSPRIYYSEYDRPFLQSLATKVRCEQLAGAQSWCIFDNTALGAATQNALELQAELA